ncbi:hypothetical protein BJX63DRAFT_283840 [Aspergillus granulosus]|uniref:Uncharacterized protein n=1 Tax=Aspergillus granulosus TaxID=176169 RepID=A0ABR4I0D3_9EURO
MTMNPYISWAIVLVVAGSLGWYYSETNAKTKSPAKPILEKTETVPVAKKQKRKAKKSPESPAAPSEKPAFEAQAPESDIPDEEIDKQELAKRFAAVKNGTSSSQFASGESKSQKKKKTKAAAARQLEPTTAERSPSRVSNRTSSTTGADADDDLSSAGSPQVNATVPAAGYVSDMLEAPAPGASILRVTGSVDSDSQKKKAKPQNFKQVETKKQRQQRVKNEARKQQVQEAEEERRKLLEKQLHTAREAERREAAKSTSVPQTNAWQSKDSAKAVNGTAPVAQSSKVELLDTFEPVAASATSQDFQALPSEEEQMRILGAANGPDAWTTVGTKKPKKKGGKTDESEASASESQPILSAPTPVEPKVKVTPTYLPDILRSNKKGHPLDSDWAA